MRVLICPDSFGGSLSAPAAADAMRTGWLRTRPADTVIVAPMTDGGPGFVDALHRTLGGSIHRCQVADPMGDQISAEWLAVDGTAYIESAAAVGLHLTQADARDVMRASSFGVGQLIADAIDHGCTSLVIGIGGTATSDGGAGMLAALGAVAVVEESGGLDRGPAGLPTVVAVDLQPVRNLLGGVDIEIATDVDNPLLGARGAAATFAPQKGASESDVDDIESALTHWSRVIGRRGDGKDAAVVLGAGAGGGIAYALIALGGRRTSGINRIIELCGIEAKIQASDLVITGEGSLDWQSMSGKVVSGIAAAAQAQAVASIAIAGQLHIGRRECQIMGLNGAYGLTDFVDIKDSLAEPTRVLADVTARIAHTWGR